MRAIILNLFVSTFAHGNIDAPSCRFALDTPGVWQGERVPSESNENIDVYELGGGIGGAIVYRHVPRDGSPSYVVKKYASMAEAKRDHRNLILLEKTLSSGVNQGKHIRAARVLKFDKHTIWLEDIRGTNIERLYEDSPERRVHYWERLWVGLNIISGSLMDFSRQREQFDRWQFEPVGAVPVPDNLSSWVEESRPGKPERRLPELLVHYEERDKASGRWMRRSIFIHGQNVILEPDGMMVIIDPG